METLNAILNEKAEQWMAAATISVSVGVSGFDSLNELGSAIERADQAMYNSRQQRRGKPLEPALSWALSSL